MIAITEISFLKKASVLIPSPHVTDDHQKKNAKYLDDNNACILINESDCMNVDLVKIAEKFKSEVPAQTHLFVCRRRHDSRAPQFAPTEQRDEANWVEDLLQPAQPKEGRQPKVSSHWLRSNPGEVQHLQQGVGVLLFIRFLQLI